MTRQWNLFAEAELGAAHDSNSARVGSMTFHSSANAFATGLGGGVRFPITHRFSYEIRARDIITFFDGKRQNNLQVEQGFKFEFGAPPQIRF